MYLDFFGFREKPFNVTPDPRFFFANREYEEAYASLLYGVRERKGFIVLTGEVGTGKTTLLRRLMDGLGPENSFAFIYHRYEKFDQLLTAVCKDLNLPVETGEAIDKIEILNEYLIGQLKNNKTTVLLVDEAQNLSEAILENLRLLSNLETATEKLLQIILCGQPEMDIMLDRPELRQLKQRVAVRGRLGTLRPSEVKPYIDYRLRESGHRGSGLFTRRAIKVIAAYSRGIPRLINIICDGALIHAYATSQQVVRPGMVAEVAEDLGLAEGKANSLSRASSSTSAYSRPREVA